jgi:hypothetical protein
MRTHLAVLVLAASLGACASLGPPLLPPPTTAEIVQMAKEGVGADEIMKRITASRAVYPLPASEFARLREQGVPDQVIDLMQRTYVDAAWFDGYLRARDDYLLWAWPQFRSVAPFPAIWPYPYWGRVRP